MFFHHVGHVWDNVTCILIGSATCGWRTNRNVGYSHRWLCASAVLVAAKCGWHRFSCFFDFFGCPKGTTCKYQVLPEEWIVCEGHMELSPRCVWSRMPLTHSGQISVETFRCWLQRHWWQKKEWTTESETQKGPANFGCAWWRPQEKHQAVVWRSGNGANISPSSSPHWLGFF